MEAQEIHVKMQHSDFFFKKYCKIKILYLSIEKFHLIFFLKNLVHLVKKIKLMFNINKNITKFYPKLIVTNSAIKGWFFTKHLTNSIHYNEVFPDTLILVIENTSLK